MAKTLGVELSPTRSTLVVLDPRAGGLRVRTLSSFECGSDEPERLAGELRRLRAERRIPKRARVVVWSASELVPTPDGDYRDRIDGVRLAGVSIEKAMSPPEALAAVAAGLGPPDPAAVAYVAVNPDGAALAVVRGGELLLGLEFESGSLEDPRKPDRSALARRLGAGIVRALRDASAGIEIERLVLCGALTNLRSLTLPLSEALARPVETLDTLEGIDTGGLNMPILDFQKRVAGLRLAWAMAAGERPPGRSRRRQARSWVRPIAAAGLLTVAGAAVVVSRWPLREEREEPVQEGRASPAESSSVSLAPDQTPPPASMGPPAPPRPAESPPTRERRTPPTAWKVRSILLAAERSLALVDGRIVGPGDRLGGETIVDISEAAIVLADPQGRRRRVEVGWEMPGAVVR